MLYIISKLTGGIVWKVGPDYSVDPALRALGSIIGPHHAHTIPQGLPNGNTLITESHCGRLFEVTPDCEVVWEYVSPHNLATCAGLFFADVFRGYRYPYDWVPQLDQPAEQAVIPPAHGEFRIAPVGSS